MSDGTALAPAGQVWVCTACGKTSRTNFGFVDDGTQRGCHLACNRSRVADPGWDESCMLNAVLCYEPGQHRWGK